uniref:Uncharacterized protein n=1 Tax=Leptospirillum ferrodiazotrophum TaxID=412449 RepID=C6HZE4_9BACT|nr:MAG: hypothetical protein UBAL3_95320002a [Leptospirillum ferrodiazotrophum]
MVQESITPYLRHKIEEEFGSDGFCPKTEIEFACDPPRKGAERKSRFFERDFPS